ncbi:uncharacterized protein LOC110446939 [Mizuhopecten yessoensis]|uniref:Tripartite motif-containing protein 45 n=1 Tax=Mizuhopecten yessoensis TaxID=6573 RepID=A0A210QWD9_MIZYE|nr:uncharacterized protein LOC110446939 [Mizuhopecten yessoensis]OWF53034.1 Tripartite motif-containing protein 45 [Mizuhopecten yessoensis]
MPKKIKPVAEVSTISKKCPAHPQNDVMFVCKNCMEDLVCSHCVATTHNGHFFVELNEFVIQKTDDIDQFLREAERDLPTIKNKIAATEKNLNGNDGYFKDVINDIQRQSSELKAEIDKISDNYVLLCEQMEEENKENLRKFKEELEYIYSNMSALVRTCRDAIESANDMEIIYAERKIPEDRDIPTEIPLKAAIFRPGNSGTEQKIRVFGTLAIEGSNSLSERSALSSSPQNLEMLSEFQHNKRVHSMSPVGEYVWLLERLSQEIVLVNLSGAVQRTIQNESRVYDIAVSTVSEHLWLSCEDRTIREVHTATIPVIRFRVDETPRCLCVTGDDYIVIGMDRKIVIYSSEGQIERAMDKFSPLARMLKRPHHITACDRAGELSVIVYDNQVTRKLHVTVVDENLQVKYHHEGDCVTIRNGSIRGSGYNPPKKFRPYDACYDKHKNMLITDMNNKSVVIVHGKNKKMETLVTEDYEPHGIALQENGNLWVSLEGNKVKVYKYQ